MKRAVLGLAAFVAVVAALVAARPAHAGPLVPLSKNDSVKARATDVYRVTLVGGEMTTVTVRGDGDTDLDLYIYDESGRLVSKDDDLTDFCVCRFFVPRTATYQIKIVNRGNVFNRYNISVR
jgi:hypothetical protein